MHEFSTRLTYLFQKYYSGDASAEETDELMLLVRRAQGDQQLTDILKYAWENAAENHGFFSGNESETIFGNIIEHTSEQETISPLRKWYWWRYAAAAILILFGLGALYKFNDKDIIQQKTAAAKEIPNDVEPGGNRATLTLADGSTILLDSASNGLLATQGSAKISKNSDGQLTYDAQVSGASADPNQINMLSTPKGGQYQITLPDGSKVWLNSYSSIRFPASFAQNERSVAITGEVYFEVKKDKRRPFKVQFHDSEIEVLGTSFNVTAYQDEPSSKTTLIEGSVSLGSKSNRKKLVPGQQAAISNDGNIRTADVDVDEVIAWKKGLFYFRDESIEQVMKKASRWYDIQVEYQGSIPLRQFTGKVSMDVNISELLNMLSYAGVNCKIENKKVIITN
ncbi:iron dicitrate transport regulator FecR [Dyadobacter luteus]|uniref:Iron dicitrate transport regulator FecR n=1 Tax=Dyadobacter luteus TaxID=2259619 RepID=A0A3D8YEX5_9BACT|nr:FecR domain-containing protein [Dyadobacter luteus]REA63035.1 iron dicitrate transport regulator FecR [Dyadobacter luteus]